MDVRAALARDHHRAAAASTGEAGEHRAERDRLIRQLRAEDPVTWTYAALAAAIGCSPELAAYAVKNAPAGEGPPF